MNICNSKVCHKYVRNCVINSITSTSLFKPLAHFCMDGFSVVCKDTNPSQLRVMINMFQSFLDHEDEWRKPYHKVCELLRCSRGCREKQCASLNATTAQERKGAFQEWPKNWSTPPTLQERRGSLLLVLLYKVIEGLVLRLPPNDFLVKAHPRRQIQSKHSKTVKQLTF